jgi:hypothetical protein
MSTCPICSHDMPARRANGCIRCYCSKPCQDIGTGRTNRANNTRVDEVAVIRLLEGWQVASTRAERIEAVRVLTGQGRSAAWIADYLRTTRRSVERYRHEIHLTPKSARKGQAA